MNPKRTTALPSIILFSTADWDNPFWTNKQHTALQLAERGYSVLYIESLGLRQPQLKSADVFRIVKRIIKFLSGARKVHSNLHVYSPLVIPFHRFSWVRKLNHVLLVSTLKYYQWKLSLNKPWVWTYNPMILELAKSLDPTKIIYHSVDDLSASPGVDSKSIKVAEEGLVKAADLVFCTSRKIEELCKASALRSGTSPDKVFFFSNVVDYQHFSKARHASTEPLDLRSIPHPRIGFVGAISEYKVDFESMIVVARLHPEMHWVLIGKIGEGQPGSVESKLLHAFKVLPNVHFIGPKAYEELPTYLAAFDIVTIPCPENEYTHAMFPMKFFEYMASGKPIVARKIHSLNEYSDYFYSYQTAEQLSEQIVRALKEGVRPSTQAADLLAQEHTWKKRLDKMLALINSA